MEYKDFEKLYRSDPVVFYLGMTLFEDIGRVSIGHKTDQELRADAVRMVSGLFEDSKIAEVTRAAKDFAGLSSVDRLSYAGRCGIKLEGASVDKAGVCPLCGGTLIYGEDASAHRPHAVGWTCAECGATGKEAYREVFDCHYDVRDKEGRLTVEHNET